MVPRWADEQGQRGASSSPDLEPREHRDQQPRSNLAAMGDRLYPKLGSWESHHSSACRVEGACGLCLRGTPWRVSAGPEAMRRMEADYRLEL
jgi:hypothetical protein